MDNEEDMHETTSSIIALSYDKETVWWLNVRGPSYLGIIGPIPWLLLPWLLASAGHQHPCYWPCRIGRSLPYLGNDFNYLCQVDSEKCHKKSKYMCVCPLKNLLIKHIFTINLIPQGPCHYANYSIQLPGASVWTMKRLYMRPRPPLSLWHMTNRQSGDWTYGCELSRFNWANTMVADALAPCVAKSSAPML